MRDWARGNADRARRRRGRWGVLPPTPPVAPKPVVISPGASGAGEPNGTRHAEVSVVRWRSGEGAPTMQWSVSPPAVQWHAQVLARRNDGAVMPLPAKDIQGVRANGQRTTWVIEAGRVGNEKPIQLTREVWTAPELMVTLASRCFDPRSRRGELPAAEPEEGRARCGAGARAGRLHQVGADGAAGCVGRTG